MSEVYTESTSQTTENPAAAIVVPSPDEQKAAWQSRVDDLATWGINLVNRTDAWGTYTSTAERAAGKSANYCFPYKAEDRKPGTFTRAILWKHFRASRNEHVCGLYSTSPEQTCRWFVIDIDVHGDDEAHLADANERYAIHLQNKLVAMKFSTILRDSNGKGGFHLWGIFVEPVPTAPLFAFLQTIVADYEQFGIKKPETFPKQPSIKRLGNYVRLPGRHHSRDHWPAIFNGSEWVWGHDAIDVILETPFNPPSLLPALPPEQEKPATPRVEQKHTKRNEPFEGEDVIGKFNQENDVEDVLLNSGKGYRRAGQVDMLMRPGKEGHEGSVYIDCDANESWHYSENDPLYCDKHRRDAFDVFCNLHHGGDVGKATHAAAKMMGIDHKSRAEKEENDRQDEWEKIRAADHAKTAPPTEPALTKDSPVRAVVRLASSYTPRPVDWLWLNRIARGKLTLIAGDPGTGKSIFTVDLTARESTGSPLPDDPLSSRRTPRSVVMLNAEDDAEGGGMPRGLLVRVFLIESSRPCITPAFNLRHRQQRLHGDVARICEATDG